MIEPKPSLAKASGQLGFVEMYSLNPLAIALHEIPISHTTQHTDQARVNEKLSVEREGKNEKRKEATRWRDVVRRTDVSGRIVPTAKLDRTVDVTQHRQHALCLLPRSANCKKILFSPS
jgi:hypothetical protein